MAEVDTITVLDANNVEREVPTLLSLEQMVASQATVAAILAKLIATPSTEAKQDAAAALLQGIIDAVDALPVPGDASAANQATIIAALTAIAGYVDGLEAALATLIGHVDGVETLIGTTNTTLSTIDGRVDTLEAAIGPTNEAAASADTGTFGLNALIKRQLAKMTSAMVAQLGARTVAQSPAVNIATDDPQIGTKVTAIAALGAGGAGLIGWLSQIWDRIGSIGTRTYSTVERVGVASTANQSAAISGTEVLLHASTRCYVLAGSGTPAPTATTGIPIEAGEKFHMRITSGHKIGVIRDSVDGFLHVVTVA